MKRVRYCLRVAVSKIPSRPLCAWYGVGCWLLGHNYDCHFEVMFRDHWGEAAWCDHCGQERE